MARKTQEDWNALFFHATQLFTPSSPVAETNLFAGRKVQIRKLCKSVAERGRHSILYGEPGVGKTSLAKLLRYFVPSGPQTVKYIRKSVVSSDTYTSIWSDIFVEVKYSAFRDGIRQEYSVSDLYPNEVTPADVVRELSQFGGKSIPIVVIDEFQQLTDDPSAKLLSETVKAVSDEGINATLIIVGVGDTVEELVRGHNSIIRCSEEVLMPRMDNDEIKELLNVRIAQLGMKFEGNAVWKIVGLAKGLPAFAHALGRSSVYAAISRGSTTVTEDDVDVGIKETISESQQTLRLSYEDATRSNHRNATFRQLITACALVKTDESGWFTPKDICAPYSKIIGDHRSVETYSERLKDFSTDKRGNILFKRGNERNYRFRFAEPAMQPYALMKGIESGFIDETAMSILSSPEQDDLFAT